MRAATILARGPTRDQKMKSKVSVVIADDHPIILLAVQEIIERDDRFQVVGVANGPSELVRLYHERSPQIIIADYNMPGDQTYGDGLQMIEYMLRHFSDSRILIFTMLSNPLIHSRLYDMGVAGVILKSGDFNEILRALQALLRGKVYQAPDQRLVYSQLTREESVQERIASLSAREYEVLRHFVAGLNGCEIATLLNRSTKTVSSQKISAMRKLDVDNEQALLLFCADANLFQ
jgi:two-component system capsular synthesis response regulator RcsB